MSWMRALVVIVPNMHEVRVALGGGKYRGEYNAKLKKTSPMKHSLPFVFLS